MFIFKNLGQALSGLPLAVYLKPFVLLMIATIVLPFWIVLLAIPYLWAKGISLKERREAVKAESKKSNEYAKNLIEKEDSAYIHAQRKRFYPEIQNWVIELKTLGYDITWVWALGSFQEIEIKFAGSDQTYPCNLSFVELGGYLQLVGASYRDGFREKKLPGSTLKDVPRHMYTTYFKALMLNRLDIFSVMIEAAKEKSITFSYCITASQRKETVTEEQFFAFCDVLAEEAEKSGIRVTGNFDTLEVTLSRK